MSIRVALALLLATGVQALAADPPPPEATPSDDPRSLRATAEALLARAENPSGKQADPDADRRRAVAVAERALAQVKGLESVATDGFVSVLDLPKPLPKPPDGLFHLAVAAWCGQVPGLGLLSQPGAAKRCGRLLVLGAELEPTWDLGAPLRSLAEFQRSAPGFLGGNTEAAVKTSTRAVAIAPRFAANQLSLAQSVFARDADRAAFEARLGAVLALPDDAVADHVDAQRRAKHEAEELLEKP